MPKLEGKSRERASGSFLLAAPDNLIFRTLLIWVISLPLAYFLALKTEELSLASIYDARLAELSEQQIKVSSEKLLQQSAHSNRLYWLFTTKADASPVFRNIVPRGLSLENYSRFLDYGDNSFYDAVLPLKNKIYLHAGFKTGPRKLISSQGTVDVPLGFALIWALWAGGLVISGLAITVAAPLKRIADLALDALSADSEARKQLKANSWAPAELNRLVPVFKSIYEKFDQELLKQAELAAEVERLRAQNVSIREEMHQLLQQSHQNLSEYTSRETEESLLRQIDADSAKLENAQEVCQKTLDHLSNRFPGSIKYAAAFLPAVEGKFQLSTYVGMDDLSLNILKSLDQDLLFDYAFEKGAVVTIEGEELEHFGLHGCTLNLGWESALYVPVAGKGKRLAVIAVYFDERIKIFLNDRRRVLQKVQDLLARVLLRISVLQNELTAARTDSLTGLFNKKFFQEFAPQLLQKASKQAPLTFLLLDGDHFKKINDTYGHQAGDLMLKTLAELMLANTRGADDLATPTKQLKKIVKPRERDYVIRWGGEEFLVLMEATDARLARVIAERLRRAVSEKHDWPAGIPKWTVSIGYATYPEDGNTVEELVGRADIALYHCKKVIGRNKAISYAEVLASGKVSTTVE